MPDRYVVRPGDFGDPQATDNDVTLADAERVFAEFDEYWPVALAGLAAVEIPTEEAGGG
jgi:hypothetical protein